MAELGGTRAAATFSTGYGYLAGIVNAEGGQYEYWKNQDVSIAASMNDATRRQWNGTSCYWWTRSPSPGCSEDDGQTWFGRAGPNGDVFSFATAATGDENVSCVLPGFLHLIQKGRGRQVPSPTVLGTDSPPSARVIL